MSKDDQAPELYRKHRPKNLNDVFGQDDAVTMLKGMGREGKIPHCLLFSGPSGVGKTTVARILAGKLGCSEADFHELNIADVRGIDVARDIRQRMHLAPVGGKCRIWLLDEVARATVDAQNAFLKMFEDTPDHVYFMLATTEPGKLLDTIRTRATEVKFKAIGPQDLTRLLKRVSEAESIVVSSEVLEKIVNTCDGSARAALVSLGKIACLKTEEERLAVVSAGAGSPEAFEIARALLNSNNWSTLAKLIKTCGDEPETTRRVCLAYWTSVLLGSVGKKADRAAYILDVMRDDFYASGKSGLAAACYEIATSKPPKADGD